MGIGAGVQSHKAKHKKETNDYTLRRLQKLGTPECHRPMISHLNIIKKCGHKVSNKGGVYYYKQIDSVNIPYKKK